MSIERVPRTKATNAYDVLDDVCAAIIEEPLRYYQNEWLIRGANKIRGHFRMMLNGAKQAEQPPRCATVGCRAGWICVLTDGREGTRSDRIMCRAKEILGLDLTKDEFSEFYFEKDISDLFEWRSHMDGAKPGTRAYARAGVREIRAFMKKWKTRLQNTPVTPRKPMRKKKA